MLRLTYLVARADRDDPAQWDYASRDFGFTEVADLDAAKTWIDEHRDRWNGPHFLWSVDVTDREGKRVWTYRRGRP